MVDMLDAKMFSLNQEIMKIEKGKEEERARKKEEDERAASGSPCP